LKIKLWHILCFITVIVGATFIVFPTQRRLAAYYVESGIVGEARGILNDLLGKQPDDRYLLRLSSALYHLEGLPYESIRDLERSIARDSVDIDTLKRLAVLYEWNRDPEGALKVWERAATAAPDNIDVLNKLIDHYRYKRETAREGLTIAHLIEVEERRGREGIRDNHLLLLLNRVLAELSGEKQQGGEDYILDTMLSGFFLLRMKYLEGLQDKENRYLPDAQEVVNRSFDLFIRGNLFNEAKSFASELDTRAGGGMTNLLQLVQSMRWSGNNQQALALLHELESVAPDDEQILVRMAEISRETNDLTTAANIYGDLLKRRPAEQRYKAGLAALYLESDKLREAFRLYRELAMSDPENNDYMKKMLEAAQYSDDAGLAAEALHVIEGVRPNDPELMRAVAANYLAAGDVAKANQLYRLLALNTGDRHDVRMMLQTAEFSDNQEVIAASLADALRMLPQDQEVMTAAARTYLSVNQPEQAMNLYRRLFELAGDKREMVDSMLEAAGSTNNGETVDEVMQIVLTRYPLDDKLAAKAAEMYLWADRPDKAYPFYKKIAIWSKGRQQDVERMIKTAEGADRPELLLDALLLARSLRPDDEAVERRLAELYLAAGRLEDAYQLYKKLYERHPAPDIEARLVEIALWTERPQEAAVLLARIAKAEPGSFDKALAAGNAAIAAGELEKGIPFLENALLVRPDRNDLRKRLATYYGWAGQTGKMIVELEYLAALDLLEEKETLLLAQAYFDHKQEQEAIGILEPLLANEILPVRAGMLLAAAYELKDKMSAAVDTYKRLARENANDAELLAKLGDQALAIARINASLSFYEAALKRAPDNTTALKGLGRIAAWNNDPDRAISLFKTFNRLNPRDYEVHYQLAELYFVNGQQGDSDREYRKSLQLIKKVRAVRQDNPDGKLPQ